jgi:Cu+-exporting ATPase
VLIIARPCALGLATQTAVMVGTGKAAELGVVIGNGDALEQSRRLTAIVRDKTGTITQGRSAVTRIHTTGGWDATSLLAVVAAAAIAIGTGLTVASHTDTAQRGMNGTLAWTESVGMPMRPSMTTMMTTEIPPVDAAEAGVHAQISLPAGTRPGVPTHVVVRVTDARTGNPITDLGLTHSVFMHLIATRADLATFTHVHPEPTGTAGELAVEMTFPTAGEYILNTEFRRKGPLADIHDRQLVAVAGSAPTARPVVPGPRALTVAGVHVEFRGTARAGTTSD